jgi:hypothetical protein
MTEEANHRASGSPPSIARIFVRPLGSTLPLGFFAFAVGTVLVSAAPLQAVASLFGFLARDSGSATAMRWRSRF